MRRSVAVVAVTLCAAGVTNAAAQVRVEKNVVYGMYSGLALLMDVYRPAAPNGRGIVVIQGSGFSRPLGYDAPQLKDLSFVRTYGERLTAAGYTVFAPNHRATPRFHYPGAVEDVQRAVRFIRANAADYGIDPARIGAVGASSGGYMAAMLGVLDGTGDPADPDPVNRLSAKVQAVVALMAPFDLARQREHSGGIPEALFVGASMDPNLSPTAVEQARYTSASPLTYVTADDAPVLMLHGDKDAAVSLEQSRAMAAALEKAGVEAQLIVVPGGDHGETFGLATDDDRLEGYFAAITRWLGKHLK
jgi:acetyl esterase/lipase